MLIRSTTITVAALAAGLSVVFGPSAVAATAVVDRGKRSRHSGSVCCLSVGSMCASTKRRVPSVSPCS